MSRGWDGVLTIFSDSEIFPPITKWSLCIKSHIGMAPQTGMGNRLVRGIHLISVRAFTHFKQRIIKTFLINVAAPLVNSFYTRKDIRVLFIVFTVGMAPTLFTPCKYVASLPIASLTRPHLSSYLEGRCHTSLVIKIIKSNSPL